ncbi:hypothetical protein GW846_06055 [Candidatus Gracilibacteria bacterium]|nr:hypothetical protein [Candidatus Gracilibacteria bacterium]
MKFKISKKIFAHIDCDSFYVACEVFRNPALVNKHVCVGGDVTIAASYSAKRKGIKVGVPFWEAKRILGRDFVGIHPDMGFYGKISKKLMTFLREHTQNIEIFSIDEAFVELTGIPESMGLTLEQYLLYLQKKILQDIGVPVSIGVSNTKLRAKMFSKVNKPYGYFVGLSNEVVYDIFQDLPVSAIPFIGKGYQKRLGQHIQTVYDFSRESMFYYKRIIGKNATQLWFEINGVNCMTFAHTGVQKSISKTRSFNDEITNRSDLLWKRLVLNVDRLFEEMILNEFQLRNITLFLRNKAFETSRMSFEFEDYHCDRKQVVEVLAQMLKELQISGELYRSTGVITTDIQKYTPKQLSIFTHLNENFQKNIALEKVLGDIHKKYGNNTLKIGV